MTKPKLRRIGRAGALVLAVVVLIDAAMMGAHYSGLRVNTTPSMPMGLYRVRPAGSGKLERGTIVAICPSRAALAIAIPRGYLMPGHCPGNVEPLLKHVVAVAGDRVQVSDAGIIVNGDPLPNSIRLKKDCQGRALPRIPAGRYTIAKGDVWLYAPVKRSWDSRYFGPAPAANVVGLATPILTISREATCT